MGVDDRRTDSGLRAWGPMQMYEGECAMGPTAILQPRDVLALLDELGDDDLCAVIARAQGRLLDRPIPSDSASTLAVEIVCADEGHLLALYRSLTPAGKHDLLARAWQRAQAAQRHR